MNKQKMNELLAVHVCGWDNFSEDDTDWWVWLPQHATDGTWIEDLPEKTGFSHSPEGENYFAPLTDHNHMFSHVLPAMREKGWHWKASQAPDGECFCSLVESKYTSPEKVFVGGKYNLLHAIAEACLRAVGAWEDEG